MGGRAKKKLRAYAAKKTVPKLSLSQPQPAYIVEKIMGKRSVGGQESYLVKWKDWPYSDNTWEPLENLSGCMEMVTMYEQVLAIKNEYPDDIPNEPYVLPDPAPHEDILVLQVCPNGMEAEEVRGIAQIKNTRTYLVKWKPTSDAEDSSYNLVKASVFNLAFPAVVIAYYEKITVWSDRDYQPTSTLTKKPSTPIEEDMKLAGSEGELNSSAVDPDAAELSELYDDLSTKEPPIDAE